MRCFIFHRKSHGDAGVKNVELLFRRVWMVVENYKLFCT